jgi:cathepsin L
MRVSARFSAVLALLALLAGGGAAAPPRWHELTAHYGAADYVRDFGRRYGEAEAAQRLALIEQRLAAVRRHNAGGSSYKQARRRGGLRLRARAALTSALCASAQGVNEFTDRTAAELSRLRGVAAPHLAPPADGAQPAAPRKAGPLLQVGAPRSLDWRSAGVVTAVKNQGGCGSCWAFAATEVVESAFAIATGRLEVLSPQQVLDCTPNPAECGGDGGCTGGTPELAFASVAAAGGLASEWTYPYTAFHGGSVGPCRFARNATPPVAVLRGYVTLPRNSYWPVLSALAAQGPLAVNVDASSWFAYETGVFDGCAKDKPDIDHAVSLVGYGTDEDTKQDFWLIRNSCACPRNALSRNALTCCAGGTAFGEIGYIRVARAGPGVACATDVTPFDGSDCRNVSNPVASVTVCGECGILYDVSYPLIEDPAQYEDTATA